MSLLSTPALSLVEETAPISRPQIEFLTPPGSLALSSERLDCYTNPVLDRNFPDPDILRVGDHYFAYATTSGHHHVQTAFSRDLVHWQMLGDALPQLPAWAAPRYGLTWAPEVVPDPEGDGWLMYYTTRCKTGAARGRQVIGMARSDNPAGPFRPVGDRPLVSLADQGGVIDSQIFVDDDGQLYLIFKNDGNSCGQRTWIYIQRLAPDGLSLTGEPRRLLTVDRKWEGYVVEAPTLWKRGGKYYLFYSANDFTTVRYGIGYAVADRLLGPYCKPDAPLLTSNLEACVIGPGGQDIIEDASGDTWLIYHSWSLERQRAMHLDRLVWHGDVPVVLGPTRSPQPAPCV